MHPTRGPSPPSRSSGQPLPTPKGDAGRVGASRSHDTASAGLPLSVLDLRVLFSFDPRRQATLLLGGDKSGAWNDWYAWAIPRPDELYDKYLQELRDEGLI